MTLSCKPDMTGVCFFPLPARLRTNQVPSIELVGSSIDLFSNRISDGDVEALVDTITSGMLVTQGLFLCVNRITDVGAAALARLFYVSRAHCNARQASLPQ
jgi:hypothetical protein